MARYRRIDVRIWNDEKVRDLPGDAKLLWLYMLTNPFTNNIPGLYRASEPALAYDLRYPLEAFREAFRIVFAKGLLKADWSACVVWIPNAYRYNKPESPNVILSWRALMDEIPSCALKSEAIRELKAFAEGSGEPYGKAFGKAMANQEQEQEQEQEIPLKPPKGASLDDSFERFWEAYPRKVGKGAAIKAWKKIKEPTSILTAISIALSWQKKSTDWTKDSGTFIPHPATYLNQQRWLDENPRQEKLHIKKDEVHICEFHADALNYDRIPDRIDERCRNCRRLTGKI